MGLFSFLTGNDKPTADDRPPAARGPQPEASGQWPEARSPQPEASSLQPEARSLQPDASSPQPAARSLPPDSPFAPPSAWETSDTGLDTGALTAPLPSVSGDQPVVGPADPELTAQMQGPIIEVIKTVFDPEIPVDIYELGLIYEIIVDADRKALVRMTLTSPACPSAQQLPSEVRYKVKALEGIADAAVEIVWEPPWDKDRMSEAAKLQLGFF
jgi:FeS assembly SUF system protein